MKKLVEKSHLQSFQNQLNELYDLCNNANIKMKIIDLIEYYEKNILQKGKEDINVVRKSLYKEIKNEPDAGKREKIYELYKELKKFNE